jgi:hypothetical protein
MASVLHGCARTTPCLRAEFQASQESTQSLAARHCLNPKTVKKWRSRTTTADAPMGPKAPRSTVLTPAEEAILCGGLPSPTSHLLLRFSPQVLQ